MGGEQAASGAEATVGPRHNVGSVQIFSEAATRERAVHTQRPRKTITPHLSEELKPEENGYISELQPTKAEANKWGIRGQGQPEGS